MKAGLRVRDKIEGPKSSYKNWFCHIIAKYHVPDLWNYELKLCALCVFAVKKVRPKLQTPRSPGEEERIDINLSLSSGDLRHIRKKFFSRPGKFLQSRTYTPWERR